MPSPAVSNSRVVAQLKTAEPPAAAERVLDLDALADRCTELRNRGLSIAHCHGCFDLMHPGHIQHFAAAKRFADVLVVTVTPDRYVQKGNNRPAFPEDLRAYSIASLACVDFVAINRWPTAEETLRLLRPSYFVKGQEFETLEDPTGKLQQEVDTVREIGAQLRFTREMVFSSTALLGQHFGVEDRRAEQRALPAAPPSALRDAPAPTPVPTLASDALPGSDVIPHLDAIAGLRVCVIGDTIVDEYHHCDPLGMASKSSVVAHRQHTAEAHAGGVLAIANHVAELCDEVHLVSVLGTQDSRERFLRGRLNPRIEARFFHRPDATSVIKRRYVSRESGQKLFEVNSLPAGFLHSHIEDEIIGHLEAVLVHYDLVLVADYGHGLLSDRIIAALQRHARRLAVNAQTNSANAGFNLITRYTRADIVCLDEREARLAAASRDGDLADIARTLAQRVDAAALVVTLGSRGCLAVDNRGETLTAAPLHDTQLVDAIGAGDAFLSCCAPAIAAGVPLPVATRLGNAAGALAVQILGNRRPVRRQELIDFLCDGPAAMQPNGPQPTATAPDLIAASGGAPSLGRAEPSPAAVVATLAAPAAGTDYPDAYYRDFIARTRQVVVTDDSGSLIDFTAGVLRASAAIDALRRSGRKLMLIGNGASAAIASHMAADYAKNGGVRALAFNDPALLTAVSNDLSYDEVFAEPIRLFADPGDILLAISSSGRSTNILHGSRAARERGCRLITLSGFREDNPLRSLGDLNFYVPCLSYGITEVLHHSLCHCILDTFMINHNGSQT